MGTGGVILVALAMLVGLVGILLPLIPGSLLIAAAALVWALVEQRPAAWVVFGVVLAILAAGSTAKWVLPSRSLRAVGAPRSTLLAGAALAVVGFFVIPVVGLLVGGLVGVYLAESARLGAGTASWRSTVTTIKAVGLGILVELCAGVLAVAVWAVAAVAL